MSEEMTALRQYRNLLLKESDWSVIEDSPLSDSKKSEWKTYRQKLRDLPDGAKPILRGHILDLSSVTFPTKPS
tara:strand:- start:51 stop:269 length:219 start_codon:yes stop_codon:yes gene_type:complete